MSKAILQLDALSCPSCMQKIKGALEKQDGVENVKVLFNAAKVKTDFEITRPVYSNFRRQIVRHGN